MDIRQLFKNQQEKNEQKRTTSKIPLIIDDEEDDEDFKDSAAPRRPAISKGTTNGLSKTRKRARQILADDSDSEPEVASKKSKPKTTPTRTSPRKKVSDSKPKKGAKDTPKKSPKKQNHKTSLSDFFGSAAIKRTEVKKKPAKKSVDPVSDNKTRISASPAEDPYEFPESPLDSIAFDDEEIARVLQEEEMKMQTKKEEQVHNDEKFSKTLEDLDRQSLKPPAKKLKLLMEKLPISRSPSKTPQSTPTKAEPSNKSSPLIKTANKKSPTKRWSKKRIKYEDEDDDITVTSLSNITPPKPVKQLSNTAKSPSKPHPISITTTPKSLINTTSKLSTPVSSKPVHTTPASTSHSRKKLSATPEPVTPSTSSKISSSSLADTPKPTRSDSYKQYLNRSGPKALGSKPIPEGQDGCLEGLTFVITGVLDSLEREDAADLVKKYGGKVTTSISGKTSYIVIGEDAGVSKLEKAEKHGTKQIDEDGLLDLIKNRPGRKAGKTDAPKKKPPAKQKSASPPKNTQTLKPSAVTPKAKSFYGKSSSSQIASPAPRATDKESECLLWVDKYRPKSTKAIVGQTGEKSNAKKLAKWLCNWENNHTGRAGGGVKRPSGGRGSQDNGSSFKAALLSGPPGIGKTTTSTLVCEENGFSYIEMNASAKRSKSALHGEVSAQLGSLSIDSFMGGAKDEVGSGRKHVLIMDEVDGMAGNEDRGGMQELIAMIKTSKIPVICICNDRQSPKVRSLANYCYDLRFQKPRAEQIKGAMMSVCFKEGIKIEPSALMEMIIASGQDVRQVLHNLSLWSTPDKPLGIETARESARNTQKHSKKNPFDVVRTVFAPRDGDRELSLFEKSDLFFHDYTIASLFVQENYLSARPASARGDPRATVKCISSAADSLCDGDLVEKQIRRSNQWELLPVQAFFSSVIPGEMMKGFLGKPVFPRWLGQNSKQSKCDRMLQELKRHTHLITSCSKTAFGLDYVPFLSSKLIHPLLDNGSEGVPDVISTMETYDLLREDWDSIQELAHYNGYPDKTSQIPSKVKASFTRTYNKDKHMSHYITDSAAKKTQKRPSTDTDSYQDDEEDNSESEDEAAPVIKVKKVQSKKGERSRAGSTTSQGSKKGKATKKGKK